MPPAHYQAYGPTVSVTEPLTPPAVAVIVTVPGAIAMAVPRLLASFEICVMVVSEELHVTEASCSVLLSLNVPVAMNRWVAPSESEGVAGVTAMETRLGGVRVAGTYSSEVDTS